MPVSRSCENVSIVGNSGNTGSQECYLYSKIIDFSAQLLTTGCGYRKVCPVCSTSFQTSTSSLLNESRGELIKSVFNPEMLVSTRANQVQDLDSAASGSSTVGPSGQETRSKIQPARKI